MLTRRSGQGHCTFLHLCQGQLEVIGSPLFPDLEGVSYRPAVNLSFPRFYNRVLLTCSETLISRATGEWFLSSNVLSSSLTSSRNLTSPFFSILYKFPNTSVLRQSPLQAAFPPCLPLSFPLLPRPSHPWNYMSVNQKFPHWDVPGHAVVKNPPANAGEMGSSPGPGRSHMPQSN